MTDTVQLCIEYTAAQAACLRFDAEIAELAERGEHKRKNKLIGTKGVKLSVARNQALRALQAHLDNGAVEAVRRGYS